jgi:hypothetical protein
MLKTDSYKNYLVLALLALVVILFILLFKKEDLVGAAEEDIVEIIVEDTPLSIPEEFKKTLQNLEISGITLGDKKGRIRLLTPDGRYFDPCGTSVETESTQSAYRQTQHTCRFEAGLGETHMMIARTNNCGSCQANNVSRSCNKRKNKRSCTNPKNSCETVCE